MAAEDFASYFATVQGLKVHYKCAGDGPPLILLHGGGNDWHEWVKNIDFLSRSFRVYAIDLPGFGLSDMPPAPIVPAWWAARLKDFMDILRIPPAHIMGHSLGGTVGLVFALDYPQKVNKLVLITSAGLGKVTLPGRALMSFFNMLRKLARHRVGPKYSRTSWADWLFVDRLPQVKAPVLILWGERDPYLPVWQARRAQRLMPNARLYIFKNCWHAPQREHTAEFNGVVSRFLLDS